MSIKTEHVDTFAGLVSITSQIKSLLDAIDDANWGGVDASFGDRLDSLKEDLLATVYDFRKLCDSIVEDD